MSILTRLIALLDWLKEPECPRLVMGYNCKGKNCECRTGAKR